MFFASMVTWTAYKINTKTRENKIKLKNNKNRYFLFFKAYL